MTTPPEATTLSVHGQAHRQQWAEPAARVGLRAKLRLRLLLDAADEGLFPVGLPVETRRYLPPGNWMPGADAPEVPAELAESGDADWETVEVTLTAPVRRAV